jgi:Flp pilus assembly protein TadG
VETALVLPFLLFLAFGVVGIGRITQAQMAVSAVAREAARTGALADNAGDATQQGVQRGYEVAAGYQIAAAALDVKVDNAQFRRCGSVTAHITYDVNLKDLPLLGWVHKQLKADHTEPVDGYRGNLTGTCP